MTQTLAMVALVVADYDEAIDFYTQTLSFRLIEDTRIDDAKRWVVVAPDNGESCRLLLARAANDQQRTRIGDQTGGRVFLFLHTDDIWRDYRDLTAKGVTFVRDPAQHDFGIAAVFEDLYGNRWDLIERTG